MSKEKSVGGYAEGSPEAISLGRIDQKPILFEGIVEVQNGNMEYTGNGMRLKNTQIGNGETIYVPDENIYTFAPLGITGLVEELSQSPYQKMFFEEMMKLNQAMVDYDGLVAPPTYGVWAYYKETESLVQYPPEELHRLSLVLRNSILHNNPEMTMKWEEIQDIFKKVNPVIMGLSVGAMIALSLELLMRPDNMILGDMGLWSIPNANRVHFLEYKKILRSLAEIKETGNIFGRNKAEVLAELMNGMYPFPNKFVYSEGFGPANFHELLGNEVMPRATFVVDEADRLSDKTEMAEFCRKHGIRYVGVTDAWPFMIFNVRAFDIDRSLPIALRMSDKEIYEALEKGSKSQAEFFNFSEKYVGEHLNEEYTFGAVIRGLLDWFGKGIPQPNTAILHGAAWLTDRMVLSLLGHETPERIIFNSQDMTVTTDGNMVPPIQI